jgi:hypothetical protein
MGHRASGSRPESTNISATLGLVLTVGLAARALARTLPCPDRVVAATQMYEKSQVVARARVRSPQYEDGRDTVRIQVEQVFKGSVPSRVIIRYPSDDCYGRLPIGESIYLVIRHRGNVHLPQSVFFVRNAEASREWLRLLGPPQVPRSGPNPSPAALAPREVPRDQVTRAEGEVVEESWYVATAELGNWAIPRFYIRLQRAFLLFEPEYVREQAAGWSDPDLVRGVLQAIPLKEPTDLYRYTLMFRTPSGRSRELEQLAIDALIAGRVIVFPAAGDPKHIRVTRDSLGNQRFSMNGVEILTTPWNASELQQISTAASD